MPKGRLALHTKCIDEREGIVEMKAYKVPKSIHTPHGTSILWSTYLMAGGLLGTTIMNAKATTAIIEA